MGRRRRWRGEGGEGQSAGGGYDTYIATGHELILVSSN